MIQAKGGEIRRLRLMQGWSQRDLAGRAGLRQATVSSAEQGKSVRPSTLRVIAQALMVTIEQVSVCPTS